MNTEEQKPRWLEQALIAALLVVALAAGWDSLVAGLDAISESQHTYLGPPADH